MGSVNIKHLRAIVGVSLSVSAPLYGLRRGKYMLSFTPHLKNPAFASKVRSHPIIAKVVVFYKVYINSKVAPGACLGSRY